VKQLSKSLLLLGSIAGLAMAQGPSHPRYNREEVAFSSTNLFTPQSLNRNRPMVGGMDVFPDGRVAFVEWGVPGSVFILGASVAQTSTNVPITRYATGLNGAMGLKIVNNSIYVMEKEGLTQLVDRDSNGQAEEFNSINQAFPSNNNMLNLAFDVGYLDGAFYAAMSSDVHTGGQDWGSSSWPGTTALAGRSTMYKLNTDGTASAVACGFRNPNGMDINGDDIFVSENQGSWTPSSKLIAVRQGRFYGHRTNPANPCQTSNNNTESPPVVWGNFGDPGTGHATGRSWGNPVVLKNPPYAGHVLIGELVTNHANNVVRVFMEDVGGELQGVILPFIKGTTTKGVYRIREGANGAIYLGILGSNCCWGTRSNMQPGFDVLRPNGATNYLEILAIRSKSNNTFELEFNKPVGTNASQANQYTVQMWQNNPVEAYGGGNMQNSQNLTVSSATVSTDRMKVTLQITGLQTNRVVKFVFNTALTAQDGSALWTTFGLYTLNKFGPGTDYQANTTSIASRSTENAEAAWKMGQGEGFHVLRFAGNDLAAKDIVVYDMKGIKRLEKRGITGSEIRLETGSLAKGMYWVRVMEAGQNPTTRHLLIP
jgi:hypothetical protein